MDRRSFFRLLAGAIASPVVAPVLRVLPAPLRTRVGAWAVATIEGGVVTSVTITSPGCGYSCPPVVMRGPNYELLREITRQAFVNNLRQKEESDGDAGSVRSGREGVGGVD